MSFVFGPPVSVPLWAVIAGGVGLGALAATLGFSWPMIQRSLRLRRQVQQIAKLEQEIHGLRTLPLAEDPDATQAQPREA